jgi:peptidoglycan/LPS O-acetylase OafA/YrhL
MIRRRLPQIVAVTGVVGIAAHGFIAELADRGMVPEKFYQVALDTFACAFVASVVIAWFHGKKGKQKIQPLEVALLSVVGIIWLLIAVWIVLR